MLRNLDTLMDSLKKKFSLSAGLKGFLENKIREIDEMVDFESFEVQFNEGETSIRELDDMEMDVIKNERKNYENFKEIIKDVEELLEVKIEEKIKELEKELEGLKNELDESGLEIDLSPKQGDLSQILLKKLEKLIRKQKKDQEEKLADLRSFMRSEFSNIDLLSSVLGGVREQSKGFLSREKEILDLLFEDIKDKENLQKFIDLVRELLELKDKLEKQENEKAKLKALEVIVKERVRKEENPSNTKKLEEVEKEIKNLKTEVVYKEAEISDFYQKLWKLKGEMEERFQKNKKEVLNIIDGWGIMKRFTNFIQRKSFRNAKLEELLSFQEIISKGKDSGDALLNEKVKDLFGKAPDKIFIEKLKDLCELKKKLVELKIELEDSKKVANIFHINIEKIENSNIAGGIGSVNSGPNSGGTINSQSSLYSSEIAIPPKNGSF